MRIKKVYVLCVESKCWTLANINKLQNKIKHVFNTITFDTTPTLDVVLFSVDLAAKNRFVIARLQSR